MANTDLAVRIATILDSTGLKKADKAFDKFEKKTKKLGKVLGVTLGAAAFGAYSRNAIRAFAADERAAVQLSQALKNLGLGFQDALAGQFVADLEKSASVADDQLRPALQALLTTTGSLAKSQELLSLAIETSRGSGVDLLTTTNDIAQAYVGNTKGLKKYYLGLTQAELKTASFATVQAKLNDQFKGSNAAYLDTTAGKLEAISIAGGNASEVIGGALVDAFISLSGSSGVDGLTLKIDSFSKSIAGAIKEFQKFAFITKYLFNLKNFDLINGGKKFEEALKQFNIDQQYAGAAGYDPTNNAVSGYKVDEAAKKKALADAEKRERELAALAKKQAAAQKALTAEQKKQAALKKAGSIFDMEQIQIIAALKGNISADERKRLELQLAIATGNVEEAKKLTYQLAISQGMTVKLAQDLASLPMANNPFAAWAGYLDAIELQAKRIASMTGGTIAGSENIPHGNVAPTALSSIASGGTQVGFGANGNIVVNVEGSVVSQDDLIAGILEGIQKRSLSGSPSAIGRIQGMFG